MSERGSEKETAYVRCILFLASCAAIILHKRSLRSVFNPLSRYLTGTADREPQISVCNSGRGSGGGDGVGEVGEAVGKTRQRAAHSSVPLETSQEYLRIMESLTVSSCS